MNAPRDNLIRMAPVGDMSAGDGRTLTGYAAVFNSDTVIKSWEGHFTERIAPGAFRKTLSERAEQVRVLFNHGMDPQIGDKPLGKPSVIREDERGLYAEVPLDDTSYNADLLASLRSGAIDGMSFRFSVVKDDWTKPRSKGELPVRTLQEVRLHEFGPVTFPAYAAATAGVRSREDFEIWKSLDEDKQQAIRNILSTPPTEAGSTTSDEEPLVIDDEPTISHSLRLRNLARARLIAVGG